MTAEHSLGKPDQTPDTETVNHLKDQLKAVWQQLPVEQKATMAIELLEDVMAGEESVTFREALDRRWPVTSESIHGTFALLTITHNDLEEIGLLEDEIKLFDEEKLRELSSEIRNHYVVQGFWEELKYHTAHFLGESATTPDQWEKSFLWLHSAPSRRLFRKRLEPPSLIASHQPRAAGSAPPVSQLGLNNSLRCDI